MKPIIVDMKDMSDSTEVYESRPNPFLIYTIYVIVLIGIVAFCWMYFFDIEVVVKSNGMFKGSNAVYEISSGVTGRVKESHVEDGRFVEEGEVLYVLDIDSLSDTIIRYQEDLETTKERLVILEAYKKSLEGDLEAMDRCISNPFYEEFSNRRELLYANIDMNLTGNNGQAKLYQGNIDAISSTITKYKEKLDKLETAKQCILTQKNTFDTTESYYCSMVNSYLASHSYTSTQYNNKINEYQRKIDDYNELLENLGNDSVSGGDAVSEKELKKQRDDLCISRDEVVTERTQALINLENQHISAIEQQIAGVNDTILSLESNLISAKLQLQATKDVDNDTKESIAILTEKGNIAAEILNYQEKQEECEAYLKSYDIQNDKCTIKANVSGYFYEGQDLKTGSYVQEGTKVGTIYPEKESKYFAEIYVENTDIAKIKEGQEVKFEIAAYPSSEYGYFTGRVENIAKDISLDQSTGYAYYLVKVSCDDMTVKNKDGEEAALINGMACQAKIVVDEKNVLTYLLEKIDLVD